MSRHDSGEAGRKGLVLVVEDDPDMQSALAEQLGAATALVSSALHHHDPLIRRTVA